MDSRETAIKIENIGKKYIIKQKKLYPADGTRLDKLKYKFDRDTKEDFWALRNINIEIKQGERVGIIGRNGAGKSTLLKLISRITEPTEGRIEYLGSIAAMLEIGTGFNPELTGRENVYLNGSILGMSKEEIDAKFDGIVEFSEIGRFIDTPIKRYSSGMMVRLAFAVSSTMNPDILIIDEVLSVGDMRFRSKCLKRMADIANGGRTIICVSHIMGIIRSLCDRAIVLDNGKIIYDGEVEGAIELYNGKSGGTKASHYEYDEKNRTRGYLCDKLIIRSLDIIGNEENIYEWNEPIKFKINVDALIDIEKICLRVRFWRDDGVAAATAFIESLISFKSGESSDVLVTIDCHNLAPGDYRVALTLTEDTAHDNYNNIDSIEPDAFFISVLNYGTDKSTDIHEHSTRFWSETWGKSRIPDAHAEIITKRD